MLKKLLKDIFNQKGIYLLLIIGILQQIMMLYIPYLCKIYVDFIQKGDLGKDFYFYIYLGIIVGTFGILLGFYSDYSRKGIIANFEIKKAIYYYKKFFSLDFEFRNNEGTGKTITKISRGIEAQTTLFNSFSNLIIIFFVRAILIGLVMFSMYKPLFGFFVFLSLIITFINKKLSANIKILTDEEQKLSENISRQTNKMIMESNLINISNKQDQEINILSKLYSKLPNIRQTIYAKNDMLYRFLHIVYQITEILCYGIFGIFVVKSQMTMGDLILITTYVWWMRWPIEIFMNNISEYRNQISKYEALENFINTSNKIIDGEKEFKIKSGEIVFENI
ncbi:MAG: ABC transporter ATP-binding protein, partial [Candidatus Gracilibacteria bacterium]|nr:ABC transporter ATP-binding protein [Candidatus Gracilibacteria bacterium]